jgi:carbon storage regulator
MEENDMLVLTRKRGEAIVIGDGITVTVLETQGNRVRLGFDAPVDVPIHRQEIHQRVAESAAALHLASCG